MVRQVPAAATAAAAAAADADNGTDTTATAARAATPDAAPPATPARAHTANRRDSRPRPRPDPDPPREIDLDRPSPSDSDPRPPAATPDSPPTRSFILRRISSFFPSTQRGSSRAPADPTPTAAATVDDADDADPENNNNNPPSTTGDNATSPQSGKARPRSSMRQRPAVATTAVATTPANTADMDSDTEQYWLRNRTRQQPVAAGVDESVSPRQFERAEDSSVRARSPHLRRAARTALEPVIPPRTDSDVDQEHDTRPTAAAVAAAAAAVTAASAAKLQVQQHNHHHNTNNDHTHTHDSESQKGDLGEKQVNNSHTPAPRSTRYSLREKSTPTAASLREKSTPTAASLREKSTPTAPRNDAKPKRLVASDPVKHQADEQSLSVAADVPQTDTTPAAPSHTHSTAKVTAAAANTSSPIPMRRTAPRRVSTARTAAYGADGFPIPQSPMHQTDVDQRSSFQPSSEDQRTNSIPPIDPSDEIDVPRLTVKELRTHLRRFGLPMAGRKADLQLKLRQYLDTHRRPPFPRDEPQRAPQELSTPQRQNRISQKKLPEAVLASANTKHILAATAASVGHSTPHDISRQPNEPDNVSKPTGTAPEVGLARQNEPTGLPESAPTDSNTMRPAASSHKPPRPAEQIQNMPEDLSTGSASAKIIRNTMRQVQAGQRHISANEFELYTRILYEGMPAHEQSVVANPEFLTSKRPAADSSIAPHTGHDTLVMPATTQAEAENIQADMPGAAIISSSSPARLSGAQRQNIIRGTDSEIDQTNSRLRLPEAAPAHAPVNPSSSPVFREAHPPGVTATTTTTAAAAAALAAAGRNSQTTPTLSPGSPQVPSGSAVKRKVPEDSLTTPKISNDFHTPTVQASRQAMQASGAQFVRPPEKKAKLNPSPATFSAIPAPSMSGVAGLTPLTSDALGGQAPSPVGFSTPGQDPPDRPAAIPTETDIGVAGPEIAGVDRLSGAHDPKEFDSQPNRQDGETTMNTSSPGRAAAKARNQSRPAGLNPNEPGQESRPLSTVHSMTPGGLTPSDIVRTFIGRSSVYAQKSQGQRAPETRAINQRATFQPFPSGEPRPIFNPNLTNLPASANRQRQRRATSMWSAREARGERSEGSVLLSAPRSSRPFGSIVQGGFASNDGDRSARHPNQPMTSDSTRRILNTLQQISTGKLAEDNPGKRSRRASTFPVQEEKPQPAKRARQSTPIGTLSDRISLSEMKILRPFAVGKNSAPPRSERKPRGESRLERLRRQAVALAQKKPEVVAQIEESRDRFSSALTTKDTFQEQPITSVPITTSAMKPPWLQIVKPSSVPSPSSGLENSASAPHKKKRSADDDDAPTKRLHASVQIFGSPEQEPPALFTVTAKPIASLQNQSQQLVRPAEKTLAKLNGTVNPKTEPPKQTTLPESAPSLAIGNDSELVAADIEKSTDTRVEAATEPDVSPRPLAASPGIEPTSENQETEIPPSKATNFGDGPKESEGKDRNKPSGIVLSSQQSDFTSAAAIDLNLPGSTLPEKKESTVDVTAPADSSGFFGAPKSTDIALHSRVTDGVALPSANLTLTFDAGSFKTKPKISPTSLTKTNETKISETLNTTIKIAEPEMSFPKRNRDGSEGLKNIIEQPKMIPPPKQGVLQPEESDKGDLVSVQNAPSQTGDLNLTKPPKPPLVLTDGAAECVVTPFPSSSPEDSNSTHGKVPTTDKDVAESKSEPSKKSDANQVQAIKTGMIPMIPETAPPAINFLPSTSLEVSAENPGSKATFQVDQKKKSEPVGSLAGTPFGGASVPDASPFGADKSGSTSAFGTAMPGTPKFGNVTKDAPSFEAKKPDASPSFAVSNPSTSGFMTQPSGSTFGATKPGESIFGGTQTGAPSFGATRPDTSSFGPSKTNEPSFAGGSSTVPAFGSGPGAIPGFSFGAATTSGSGGAGFSFGSTATPSSGPFVFGKAGSASPAVSAAKEPAAPVFGAFGVGSSGGTSSAGFPNTSSGSMFGTPGSGNIGESTSAAGSFPFHNAPSSTGFGAPSVSTFGAGAAGRETPTPFGSNANMVGGAGSGMGDSITPGVSSSGVGFGATFGGGNGEPGAGLSSGFPSGGVPSGPPSFIGGGNAAAPSFASEGSSGFSFGSNNAVPRNPNRKSVRGKRQVRR